MSIYQPEIITGELRGMYRDVLRDQSGRVVWDSQWNKNAIVVDCRKLLAAFIRSGPAGPPPSSPPANPYAQGILGIRVGAGSDSWDNTTTTASPSDTALTDTNYYTLSRTDPDFKIDFLDTNTSAVVSTATTKLQIVAKFGPNKPNWPDGGPHPTGTLREFGLYGQIEGTQVLINYVRHPAIAKDPQSTLERTIWLNF
jgi:hypothetical protein